MKQNKIYELLKKVTTDCRTLDEARRELLESVWHAKGSKINLGRAGGPARILSEEDAAKEQVYEQVVSLLLIQTACNQPQKLLELFPIFAMLCGDRKEGEETALVDWEICKESEK